MARVTDTEALRAGDEVELHDNEFFKSIGFKMVKGIIKKITSNGKFVIDCHQTRTTHNIELSDGYMVILNQEGMIDQ